MRFPKAINMDFELSRHQIYFFLFFFEWCGHTVESFQGYNYEKKTGLCEFI